MNQFQEEFLRGVGARLAKARKSKGLSLQDLANHSNLEKANLSRIENGKTNTTMCTVKVLCDCLGVHMSELLEGY